MKRTMLTTVVLIVALTVCAAPNRNEVKRLKNFLQTATTHGKPNYQLLNIPLDEPAMWSGVKWSDDGHVTAIEWRDKKLGGALDVSGFTALQSIDVAHNELTMLNVTGCVSLLSLDVSHNHLSELDLDNCPKLMAINCYRNRLTTMPVTGTPMLKMLNCTGNLFVTLDVTAATMLETLYAQSCHLESLDVDSCANLSTLYCGYNHLT